jgi:hypothetical protein
VWDIMHIVDYLLTRPDVDPTRVGITGGTYLFLSLSRMSRPQILTSLLIIESHVNTSDSD